MLSVKNLRRSSRSRSSTPSPISSTKSSPVKSSPGRGGSRSMVQKMGNALSSALRREKRTCVSRSPNSSPCSSANNSPVRDVSRTVKNIESCSPVTRRNSSNTANSLPEVNRRKSRSSQKSKKTSNPPLYINNNNEPISKHSLGRNCDSSPEKSILDNDITVSTANRLEKKKRKNSTSKSPIPSPQSSPIKINTSKDSNSLTEDLSLNNSKTKTASVSGFKSSKRSKYSVGHDVLARWNDGLFYYGYVVKVKDKEKKCLIQFEDKSEFWVLYKDIQRGAKEGDLITCCVCQNDCSEAPNEIVLCDNCGLGYHQECHNPTIDGEVVLDEDSEWCCRLCVFAATVKRGGALKIGPNANALQKMKRTFPYNLHKLTWDAHRRTNVEQCYCYCGGPGNWYLKMLQCCRCRQWFHEACIQCLDHPLMNGDRFYVFVCSHCNHGPEYSKRLQLKWVDITHLALYNLTLSGIKKYYDMSVIMPFINDKWEDLQLGNLASTPEEERARKVLDAMYGFKSRFASGVEYRKKHTLWGLRMRVPPPGPTIVLPADGHVDEEVMKAMEVQGRKSSNVIRFVPIQCASNELGQIPSLKSNSPVPLKSCKASDDSIAFKSRKACKQLMLATQDADGNSHSCNQDYHGYNGTDPFFKDMSVSSTKVKANVKVEPPNSLEGYIPRPSTYSGFNHPFKTELEQKTEFAKYQRKVQIMNYLYQTCDSDTTSQSSLCSGLSASDDPTKLIPTPPPSVTSSQSINESITFTTNNTSTTKTSAKRGRGRKRKVPEETDSTENGLALRRSKRSRLSISGRSDNVIDAGMIEQVKSQVVSMDRIRTNIISYFGAADRLKKGEKYEVQSKRVTAQGKVQYLISWDGIVS